MYKVILALTLSINFAALFGKFVEGMLVLCNVRNVENVYFIFFLRFCLYPYYKIHHIILDDFFKFEFTTCIH